jgi:hypothetical protein
LLALVLVLVMVSLQQALQLLGAASGHEGDAAVPIRRRQPLEREGRVRECARLRAGGPQQDHQPRHGTRLHQHPKRLNENARVLRWLSRGILCTVTNGVEISPK